MTLDEGTRFMVMAPVVRGRKGEYKDLLEELREEGFTRAKIDGELRRLEDADRRSTRSTSTTSPWSWTGCR